MTQTLPLRSRSACQSSSIPSTQLPAASLWLPPLGLFATSHPHLQQTPQRGRRPKHRQSDPKSHWSQSLAPIPMIAPVALQESCSDSTQAGTYIHKQDPHAGTPGSGVGPSGTVKNRPSLSLHQSPSFPPCQTAKAAACHCLWVTMATCGQVMCQARPSNNHV